MVGFLHGIGQTAPPDNMIRPLRPALWRGTPSSAPFERVHSYGAQYVLVLSDLWGYPVNGSPHGVPYEHPKQWVDFVRRVATSFRGQDVVFDVWNEPDTTTYWGGTPDQLFETYAMAARALQSEIGPSVRIAGPSLGRYNPAFISRFLRACLDTPGCRITELAWHEFPGPDPPISSITAHLRDARQQFLRSSRYSRLGLERVYVTETVNSYSQYLPAETLAALSALEQGGADGAAHACWSDSRGRNQCSNDTLDGLLTPREFRPLPPWWSYKLYSDGVATRVAGESHDDSVVVLASVAGATDGGPQVLVGRIASASSTAKRATVTLDLSGLDTLPVFAQAGHVVARFERIPDQGYKALGAPQDAGTMTVPVQNGFARIRVARFGIHDMYAVTLSPA